MAIIWAGSSIADGVQGVNGEPSAITTNIPTTLVKEGISIGNWASSSKIQIPPTTDIWFGFHSRFGTVDTNGGPVGTRVRRAGGGGLMGVRPTSDTVMTAWVDNGAGAFLNLGTFSPTALGVSRFDIHFKYHATDGELAVYQNGVELYKFNGQTDYFGGIHSFVDVLLGGWRDTSNEYSAMIIADEDTRPLLCHQVLPNSNGAAQEWTGGYANIDETGINDSDNIVSGAINQKSLFGFQAQGAATTGRSVETVILSARGLGPGPQAIRGVARYLTTEAETLSETDVLIGYSGLQYKYPLNPVTGEAWTLAEINAAQFGVRSA